MIQNDFSIIMGFVSGSVEDIFTLMDNFKIVSTFSILGLFVSVSFLIITIRFFNELRSIK